MNMKTKLIRFFILLALVVLPTSTAYAQSPNGDVVLFGQNYTLATGDELDGSLAVLGGNITIEEDASVTGDVALIGGNIEMDGEVQGDLAVVGGNLIVSGTVDGDIVIIGGQVQLTATAVVNGGITTVGGQLDRDPEAQVNGDIVNNAPPTVGVPDVPGVPNVPSVNSFTNPLWEAVKTFGIAVIMAAVAMLLMLFLQPQIERVGDAIVRQPLIAGSFGLLTVVLSPLALFIMIITIILIPVAAIVAFVLLPIAWLFGMVAIGEEVGERFTKAINQTWAPVLTTGFGTFIVMFIGGFVGMLPCVGWLVPFTLGLMGIGGVLMTWFGTRSAPGAQTQIVDVTPTP